MIKKLTLPKLNAIAIALLALSGCGSESEILSTSPQPPSSSQGNVAIDGFDVVKPGEPSSIDLSKYLRGNSTFVRNIEPSNPELCPQPDLEGNTFSVQIENGAYCNYRYVAVDGGKEEYNAEIRLLATDVAMPLLPAINQTALVDGTLSLDLQTLLTAGDAWPANYSLLTSSIEIQGMGGATGTFTTAGNIINYTAPSLAGWNRILYTLIENDKPQNAVIGIIYITVSDGYNEAPVISPEKFNYTGKVDAGTEVLFDLSKISGLSITDKDEWQITSVSSFDATVKPAAPDNVLNKAFTFQSAEVGNHVVNYIVSDHHGGSQHGMINITVSPKEKPKTWGDVTSSSGDLFVGPLLYSEAKAQGLAISALWDDTLQTTIAGFTNITGNSYCLTVGRLPTEAEFTTLKPSLPTDAKRWPLANNYLVTDNTDKNSYKIYDVSAGTASAYPANPTTGYAVACLKNQALQIIEPVTNIIADGQTHLVATVKKPNAASTLTMSKVSGDLVDGADNFSIATGYQQNTTYVQTSSTKSGTYQFKLVASDTNDSINSPVINYVANNATAALSSDSGIVNNAEADGKAFNRVVYRLQDENNNPIIDANLNITLVEQNSANSSAELTTSPSTKMTDKDGELAVNITNTEAETVTLQASYTVPNVEPEKTVTTNPVELVFGPVIPKPVVTPLTEGSGTLFTSSPSAAYYTFLGFLQGGNWSENNITYVTINRADAQTWCETLAVKNYGNRNNWTLASLAQLESLHGNYLASPNISTLEGLGWAVGVHYWTSTAAETPSNSWQINMETANKKATNDNNQSYASCVSLPAVSAN